MSHHDAIKALITSQLGEGSRVEVYHVSSKKIDLLIISPAFEGVDISDREIMVSEVFTDSETETQLGLMSLYTEEEAEALGVTVSVELETTEGYPSTWFDLMKWSLEGRQYRKTETTPKIVAFYSFKGGVGRTTALVHAAWALANKGKKVVMIDMDFEAPSLHQAVGKKKNESLHGLVDYLYERMNLFGDQEPQIKVTDLLEEVEVQEGRLLVIPAGRVDIDYITKVDDLRHLRVNNSNLWNTFKLELVDQVQPDLILIDTRTGINLWGALSILTIADDSILFVNPNPQNREGIRTILTALNKVGISPQVVLSPVINNEIGRERALNEWKKISTFVWEESRGKSAKKKPILIEYSSGVALADTYPHDTSLSNYQEIIDLLDDEADRPRRLKVLRKRDVNEILKTLVFRPLEAQSDSTQIEDLFQKTPGFEKFIDPTTLVIKGRKGVGKTQLFWTALNRMDLLQRYASNRLENVTPIYGHSDTLQNIPFPINFVEVEKELLEHGGDWKSFWLVFAFYQLLQNQIGRPSLSGMKSLLLDRFMSINDVSELVGVAMDPALVSLVEDGLKKLHHVFEEEGATFWILYDGFEDVEYENQSETFPHIRGLLEFSLLLDELKMKSIRLKVFMHTNTWSKLDDAIIRKFLAKDMQIKWKWQDMMQIAYSQAMLSTEFRQLAEEYVGRSELRKNSYETMEKIMGLVWGSHVEFVGLDNEMEASFGVLSLLIDGNLEFFPKTIIELLKIALEVQLENNLKTNSVGSEDRLLEWSSLVKGHNNVIGFRMKELVDEYPVLTKIRISKSTGSSFSESELQEQWEAHNQGNSYLFELYKNKMLESGIFSKSEGSFNVSTAYIKIKTDID